MWTVIVMLILVGLLMLVLEVVVIPGTGMAGIVGFLLMAAGIWLAYTREGAVAGHIVLASTVVINAVSIVLMLRSKTWRKAMLKTVNKGRVNEIDKKLLVVGLTGVTISRCAPMGKAKFGDEFYEVSTLSEFIDQNEKVEIIRISGNKIFIKKNN